MNRIAIHSVPRSGSTWLGEIFNSHPKVIYKYQPLFSYAFKGRLTKTSSAEEIYNFFEEISKSEDEFLNQTEARNSGKMPVFPKDNDKNTIVYKEVRYHHILENVLKKDTELKIIGLIRNPLSVIYSWLNAPKEFRKELGWLPMEEWQFASKKNLNKLEEFNGYEKWKEVAMSFIHLENEFPNQFKIVFYSDLILNTSKHIEELFNFCQLDFSENSKMFIEHSKLDNHMDAYSVFKTKSTDNSWYGKLDDNIISYIKKDLKNTSLEKYLK